MFLRLNGLEPESDSESWTDLPLKIAAFKLDRDKATQRLRALVSA